MVISITFMRMLSLLAEEKTDMQLDCRELQLYQTKPTVMGHPYIHVYIYMYHDKVENRCPDTASRVCLMLKLST